MKKILISFLCIALLVLTSCKVVAEPSDTSSEQQTTTTATTVPTTTVNPEDELYAKLSRLTKEDGTGEISLEMSADEIGEVLDKYDIPYKVDGNFVSVEKNGYITDYYGGYGNFRTQHSYKGLKVGDPVDKITQIYGPADNVFTNGATTGYVYHQRTASDIQKSPIDFTVQAQCGAVTSMFISIEPEYDMYV